MLRKYKLLKVSVKAGGAEFLQQYANYSCTKACFQFQTNQRVAKAINLSVYTTFFISAGLEESKFVKFCVEVFFISNLPNFKKSHVLKSQTINWSKQIKKINK